MANLLDLEFGDSYGSENETLAKLKKAGLNAGLLAGGFAPGAGMTDYMGYYPNAEGGYEPSAMDNFKQGNYGTALMQLLGAGGDMMYAAPVLGATVGSALKAPRAAQKALQSTKRMSKAENEAAGLYHPIGGGLKLDKPVTEMGATRAPVRDLPPRQVVSPEQLLGGKIIPAVGDRTAAGSLLSQVDDTPLASPVLLEGGPDFMRTHLADKAAWASDKGVITRLSRHVQSLGGNGDDVFMMYSPMGHTAGDYSTMMSDALLGQIPNTKLTKKSIKAFNNEIRQIKPDFLGIDHPEVREQLLNDGPLRLALVDRMGLAEYQNMGFPNVASTRAAILEPDLMDVPLNASGFSIAKMDPTGRVMSAPPNPHTTYNTQLGGEYIGGLDASVPREIMFRDFFDQRRMENAPTSGDNRAFMLSNIAQNADQQWLDGVMQYLEQQKKIPGLLD